MSLGLHPQLEVIFFLFFRAAGTFALNRKTLIITLPVQKMSTVKVSIGLAMPDLSHACHMAWCCMQCSRAGSSSSWPSAITFLKHEDYLIVLV